MLTSMVILTIITVVCLLYCSVLFLKTEQVPTSIKMLVLFFGSIAMTSMVTVWLAYPEVNTIAGYMWFSLCIPSGISLYHIAATREQKMPWWSWP